jgi:hypothetical protein
VVAAPPATRVLPLLTRRLAQLGYAEVTTTLGPLTPWRPAAAARLLQLDPDLRAAIDLFLLGGPVAADDLPDGLLELADPLTELGVLVRTGDGCLCTPNLSLLPVWGHWVFADATAVDPKLYLGDDSLALLARLTPVRNGRCLDLCCGPGVQSLHLSSFGATVTGVEVNPVAAGLASLNVAMNERSDTIRILVGDLYAPLPPGRYDTIVANPPLLPVPDDLPYPFVGHGGADGMRVTWRILDGLPERLERGGAAQIIGTGLSDGILPYCAEPMQAWARTNAMDVDLTVPAHRELRPGTGWFEGIVSTVAMAAQLRTEDVAERFARALDEQQATHLCGWYLRVAHGTGALRVRDLGGQSPDGLWFA